VLGLAGLTAAFTVTAHGQPQPGPPADRDTAVFLMETPLTLLDWGMLRLERDLERTVQDLRMDQGKQGPPRVGTVWRFADRRVLAYVSLPLAKPLRTESYCRDLFTLLRGGLLQGAPGGAGGAEWYLTRTFTSDVMRQSERPAGFGAKLVDMVLLEVTLRVPEAEAFTAGNSPVACAGRLDAEMAYIVPPPT